jgi:hypothetical protein
MPTRVRELHCIMPLENIPAVLRHGILSHAQAAKLPHRSVAMDEVQERRDAKQVPKGLKLHQYANLYFHARNPMMYKRRQAAADLCVLIISSLVLPNIRDVVVTDRNASSGYTRFLAPRQLDQLDLDAVYAPDWRHPDDPIAYHRHKSQKCAEVLVPHCVPPSFITGAYVVNAAAEQRLRAAGFVLPIAIEPGIFFS